MLRKSKLFEMIRELALSQKVLLPGQQPPGIEDESVETGATSKLKYGFLGLHVCKQGLSTLLGVGWNPRLSTILKSVLEGRRSAPVDRRFMERPMHDARPVYSEVHICKHSTNRWRRLYLLNRLGKTTMNQTSTTPTLHRDHN